MNYYFKVHFKPVYTCIVCAWVRFMSYTVTVKILGLQSVDQEFALSLMCNLST